MAALISRAKNIRSNISNGYFYILYLLFIPIIERFISGLNYFMNAQNALCAE